MACSSDKHSVRVSQVRCQTGETILVRFDAAQIANMNRTGTGRPFYSQLAGASAKHAHQCADEPLRPRLCSSNYALIYRPLSISVESLPLLMASLRWCCLRGVQLIRPPPVEDEFKRCNGNIHPSPSVLGVWAALALALALARRPATAPLTLDLDQQRWANFRHNRNTVFNMLVSFISFKGP